MSAASLDLPVERARNSKAAPFSEHTVQDSSAQTACDSSAPILGTVLHTGQCRCMTNAHWHMYDLCI